MPPIGTSSTTTVELPLFRDIYNFLRINSPLTEDAITPYFYGDFNNTREKLQALISSLAIVPDNHSYNAALKILKNACEHSDLSDHLSIDEKNEVPHLESDLDKIYWALGKLINPKDEDEEKFWRAQLDIPKSQAYALLLLQNEIKTLQIQQYQYRPKAHYKTLLTECAQISSINDVQTSKDNQKLLEVLAKLTKRFDIISLQNYQNFEAQVQSLSVDVNSLNGQLKEAILELDKASKKSYNDANDIKVKFIYELEQPFFDSLTKYQAQRVLFAKLFRFANEMKKSAKEKDPAKAKRIVAEAHWELAKVREWWNRVEITDLKDPTVAPEATDTAPVPTFDPVAAKQNFLTDTVKIFNAEQFTGIQDNVNNKILKFIINWVPAAAAVGLNLIGGADSIQSEYPNFGPELVLTSGTASGLTNGINTWRSGYLSCSTRNQWDNFWVLANPDPREWIKPDFVIDDDGIVNSIKALRKNQVNQEAILYNFGSALLLASVMVSLIGGWGWVAMLYILASYVLCNRFQTEAHMYNLYGKIFEKVFGKREHWYEYLTTNALWILIVLILGGFIAPVMGYVIYGKLLSALSIPLGVITSVALMPVLFLTFGVIAMLLAYFMYDSDLHWGWKMALGLLFIAGLALTIAGIVLLAGFSVNAGHILAIIAAATIAIGTGIVVFKMLGNGALRFLNNFKSFWHTLTESYKKNPTSTFVLAFLAIPFFIGAALFNALVFGALSVFGLEGTLPFFTIAGENAGMFALGGIFGFSIWLASNSVLVLVKVIFEKLIKPIADFSLKHLENLSKLLTIYHHINPSTSALFSITLVPLFVILATAIATPIWLIYATLAGIAKLCGANHEWISLAKFVDSPVTFIARYALQLVCHYTDFLHFALFQETFKWINQDKTYSEAYKENWLYAVSGVVILNAFVYTATAAVVSPYSAIYATVGLLYKTITGIVDSLAKLWTPKAAAPAPTPAWRKTIESAPSPDSAIKSVVSFMAPRINKFTLTPPVTGHPAPT